MGTEMSGSERLVQLAMGRDLSDRGAARDAFDAIRLLGAEDEHLALSWVKRYRSAVGRYAAERGDTELFELYNKALVYAGAYDFDSFMLALERNRPIAERFWQPRRKKLLPVCHALQDMEDGKLDELFLSCPPRIGKSTLMLMFFLWVMGRDSERSNLYCSYTDSVVGVLYNGILEVLLDSATYAFGDIFPNRKIAGTNAKDLLINMDRKKRYASFTGRSLYGTLNGACDCNGYLVGDDLISGIEEAMNKDRLASAWAKVDNNMLPRAKETARVLWIGTRWSILDPQGIRIDLLENDPKYADRRWRVLNTPALDENDESNFDYDYKVGFTTQYYRQRRASFERNNDSASWLAQYQGEPIERDGTVFDPAGMKYYNGELPDADPDRIFMAIDPAWGGGDFVAAPICVQYGDDVYVVDVVYSDADKSITQPMIVNAVKRHNVGAIKVEGTKMTASYGEDIDKSLRAEDIRVNMRINTSHFTGTGKRTRIFDKAPDIREHMIFLSEGHRSKDYSKFMQSVFSFTVTGKQAKHDDAADSLAMAIDFATFGHQNKVQILKKFF